MDAMETKKNSFKFQPNTGRESDQSRYVVTKRYDNLILTNCILEYRLYY